MRPERNFGDLERLCYPVLLSNLLRMASQREVEAPVVISRANSAATDRNCCGRNLRRTPNERSIFRKLLKGDDAADMSCPSPIE
jgi:hypothetical protein